jgi:protein-S-isoprenylcysteine O-methyltransferase Ste14
MSRAVSVAGFALMVAAVVGLFYTGALLSPNPIVIAVQAGALLLMLWARRTFGLRSFHAAANPTEGGVVTTGPYHFIRHPIYTAAALFMVAGALAHLSLVSAGLVVVGIAGCLMRMLTEERLLRQRYPDYAAYAASTKRMIPGIF